MRESKKSIELHLTVISDRVQGARSSSTSAVLRDNFIVVYKSGRGTVVAPMSSTL